MRRWFIVLMLLVLPVQFTWAAVAEHRSHALAALGTADGAVWLHHGHFHGHLHGADDEASAAVPSAAGDLEGSAHEGCDPCHGHCVGLLEVLPLLSAQAPDAGVPSCRTVPWADLAPAAPERPQWARLA